MTRWLLQGVTIEGFRGINNEGDPLSLRFKVDSVCSISAPNGVGKSSIFDAVSYAIRGSIPKLDGLAASENGQSYYVNRFHSAGVGTVTITLVPDGGGTPVPITVRRNPDGSRTVSAPAGVDGEGTLRQLDREFVLLDHDTFQSFISNRDLDRGRSFSGLLGLKRYSEVRQELQAIGNTRAFNNHFGNTALEQKKRMAEAEVAKHRRTAQKAFQELAKKPITDFPNAAAAHAAAHAALNQIALLKPHCDGKPFDGVDLDGCVLSIRQAEGGTDRTKLAELVGEQASLEAALSCGPNEEDYRGLRALAEKRDQELAQVGSTLLRQHLQAADRVLASDDWPDKTLCPTCESRSETPVLEKVRRSLSRYQSVADLAAQIIAKWAENKWTALSDLEDVVIADGDPAPIANANSQIDDHSLSVVDIENVWALRQAYRDRLNPRLEAVRTERQAIEQRLPPSLVDLTTSVEAAKRLKDAWRALSTAESDLQAAEDEIARVVRLKRFLDSAADRFATAESEASRRRLAAVEPVCRDLFAAIIHDPVTPALVKRQGGEELALSLSRFWNLQDVSAQALLAESFRNAFAVSVFLGAAKLYGGGARFILLDDVTSSFDAGHQFHLMEVIRTKFARPGEPTGPQVILLSHDTLLEKLFNKNANGTDWQHTRLEGTARTAVLPQSNAANRVRDATLAFLNAGQVEDGALRLRQYIEYKLLEIIGRVNISVPVDFALDDTKKQVQSALDAIQSAVALHQAAGQIVLTQQQQAGLRAHVASITGNFLAHYATGSTQAFSGSSLLGVVRSIDHYAECFMYEDPPGSGTLRYYRSLSRR